MWGGGDVAVILLTALGAGSVFALAAGTGARWIIDAWRRGSPSDTSQRAVDLLKERYTLGEVDLDEYLQRRGYLQLGEEVTP